MSTDYTLRCPTCQQAGGFFSRQAWGWGNCDIFTNFKFMVAHSGCGTIEIVREDDERYGDPTEDLAWLKPAAGNTHE